MHWFPILLPLSGFAQISQSANSVQLCPLWTTHQFYHHLNVEFTRSVKVWLIVQTHPGCRPMRRSTLPPQVLSSASSFHKLGDRRGGAASGPSQLSEETECHWYTKPSRRLWNLRPWQHLWQCERQRYGQPEVSAVSPVSTYRWRGRRGCVWRDR